MDPTRPPSRVSRVDLRYRHRAQEVSPITTKDAVQDQDAPEFAEKEEESSRDEVDEPLLIRELKGRSVMGRAHRMFHRRAAASDGNTLTVNVEVVATLDASGNVVAKETVTPAIPTVPAVPTAAVPSVPAVPPFPSDLTVPAYPWPSGVPTVQDAVTSTPLSLSSLLPTTTPESIIPGLTTALPSSLGFNSTSTLPSTISSSSSSSSSFFSSLNSTSTRSSTSSSSSSSSSTASPSSSRSSTSSALSTTSSATTSASSTAASSRPASSSATGSGFGGAGGPANTASPPTATDVVGTSNADDDGGTALGTPKIVGSVFGSLAGAALILALMLFLIKRHKRKQRGGALQLGDEDNTNAAAAAAASSGERQMTQPAATRSPVVPSFLNRFSGASRSTVDTNTTGERSFQRISGRKLPSAFSEGMTSEQFARGEATLSGSSFYHDDKGFYGGPGVTPGVTPGIIPKEIDKETSPSSGDMGTVERVMPSPARTPVIRHPDEGPPPFGQSRNGGGTLSPPLSPNPDFPPRGSLGRSHPSHDGSRSSRFTENV